MEARTTVYPQQTGTKIIGFLGWEDRSKMNNVFSNLLLFFHMYPLAGDKLITLMTSSADNNLCANIAEEAV